MDSLKLITLGSYAVAFAGFTLLVGRALRLHGRVFLAHTFQERPEIVASVDFLLTLGFYAMCGGLLLWNLGYEPSGTWNGSVNTFVLKDAVQDVAFRLGVSIFVVSAFHTVNVLILSVLNRNNRPGQ